MPGATGALALRAVLSLLIAHRRATGVVPVQISGSARAVAPDGTGEEIRGWVRGRGHPLR